MMEMKESSKYAHFHPQPISLFAKQNKRVSDLHTHMPLRNLPQYRKNTKQAAFSMTYKWLRNIFLADNKRATSSFEPAVAWEFHKRCKSANSPKQKRSDNVNMYKLYVGIAPLVCVCYI